MRRFGTLALPVLGSVMVAVPAAGSEGEPAAPGLVGDLNQFALAVLLGIVVGIVAFAVSDSAGPAPDEDERR